MQRRGVRWPPAPKPVTTLHPESPEALAMQPVIHSLLDTDLYKFTMWQAMLHRFPQTQAEYSFLSRRTSQACRWPSWSPRSTASSTTCAR
jgi:hypothetical protein